MSDINYSSPLPENEKPKATGSTDARSSVSAGSVNLNTETAISLKDLILKMQEWGKYLRSKWLIVLIAGFIGGLSGLTYAFFKKPVYHAELSFALEDEQTVGGLGGALGLASQFGFDLGGGGGGAFSGDNLLELMKSRTMVQKTLLTSVVINGKPQTLAELYINYNKLREEWGNKPILNNIQFLPSQDSGNFTRIQDSLLGEFHKSIIRNNLSVTKVDKKLSIVSVKINSENELFSKYFTEVLVSEVADFYIETKTRKGSQNVTILQHQTDSVRRQLNYAIAGVAMTVDANPNANPARQVLRVPSQRRQVDVQANQAILMELVKNLEISKVSLRKETPLIQIIDKPVLPLEKSKIGRITAALIGFAVFSFLIVLYLISRRIFIGVLRA